MSKLSSVKTSIFTTMSALAREENAINLSQGFPDFSVDPSLINSIKKYYSNGFNQYAPMQGIESLRKILSELIFENRGKKIDPDFEITITAGATQAIFTAIAALVDVGYEVIYFSPAYDCYAPTIKLFGGVPIEVPLSQDDFSIDWELVKQLVNEKTRLIIINSPHNPTGSILTKSDLLTLQSIVSHFKQLFVLSDEVYEHIIFDGNIHESVLKFPVLFEKSFVVFSFGKSLHATGWKLGYCVAPPHLTEEFRKVHQFNVFSCNTPTQYGIAEYIENRTPFRGISNMYEQKRNLFLDLIKGSKFTPISCKGTYFQLLSYKNISEEDDVTFAKRLTKDYKIASIPISVFFENKRDDKILRFCFAKQEETLKQAAEKLCSI